jgi:uncharacterized membrane protein YadS
VLPPVEALWGTAARCGRHGRMVDRTPVAAVGGPGCGSSSAACSQRRRRGLRWAARRLLRLDVVLVGLQLGLDAVAGLGTGPVVAAASPAGAAAVSVAVVVKLTRVLLLAPMVAGVAVLRRRRAPADGARPPLVPLFVVGFVAIMALRSTGAVPPAALSATALVTTVLFAAALFALGTAVRPGALLRTGRRGLLLGACSTVLVASVAGAGLGLSGFAA